MAALRTALPALLCITVVACGAGVEPPTPATQPTGVAQVTLPPVTATPAVTPEQAPPTESPTAERSPEPTSVPVPPKPSGMWFAPCCGEGNWDPSHLSWAKPRTEGVEIRVYGVTTCFPAGDGSDESCLRVHTALPDDVRVLLAKAPASKGEVAWEQGEGDGGECVAEYLIGNGTPFYSVVVAAYNASGHSIFAIVDEGYADISEACAPYVIQPGDTLSRIAARFSVTVDELTAANESTLPNPNKLPVGGTILIPQPAP